jgi:hypothetical protein
MLKTRGIGETVLLQPLSETGAHAQVALKTAEEPVASHFRFACSTLRTRARMSFESCFGTFVLCLDGEGPLVGWKLRTRESSYSRAWWKAVAGLIHVIKRHLCLVRLRAALNEWRRVRRRTPPGQPGCPPAAGPRPVRGQRPLSCNLVPPLVIEAPAVSTPDHHTE